MKKSVLIISVIIILSILGIILGFFIVNESNHRNSNLNMSRGLIFFETTTTDNGYSLEYKGIKYGFGNLVNPKKTINLGENISVWGVYDSTENFLILGGVDTDAKEENNGRVEYIRFSTKVKDVKRIYLTDEIIKNRDKVINGSWGPQYSFSPRICTDEPMGRGYECSSFNDKEPYIIYYDYDLTNDTFLINLNDYFTIDRFNSCLDNKGQTKKYEINIPKVGDKILVEGIHYKDAGFSEYFIYYNNLIFIAKNEINHLPLVKSNSLRNIRKPTNDLRECID